MEFGIQFFPAVGPDQKPADQYWREALELTQLAERLGFTNVRTVEHYFLSYGGYSPDPLIFLSAAAAVTRSIRLITGAVLPVFNNPLKLAGQIGMVDAISGGRLEVGFARAFFAPRVCSLWHLDGREPRALRRRARAGPPFARGGQGHGAGPLPQFRKRDLAAASDPEAAAAVLDRRAVHQGIVRERGHARPLSHGHSPRGRAHGKPAPDLSRRLDGGRTWRPRQGDAGVSHVLRG